MKVYGKVHWYEAPEIGKKEYKIKRLLKKGRGIHGGTEMRRFVVCVDNADYPASLELLKIYAVVADVEVERAGLMRVVDESDEDYSYPAEYFRPIDLPQELRDAVLKVS